jgi:hypothetical protein
MAEENGASNVSQRGDRDRYLSTKQAAYRLGLSHRSLERWRDEDRGPLCRRHGGRWAYLIQDLDDWSRARTRGGDR